jgi:NAD(P)H dehydrogenase (quinone)
MSTTTGGTPYGVSHLAHSNGSAPISPEEARLAIAQGKRLAEVALRLKAGK